MQSLLTLFSLLGSAIALGLPDTPLASRSLSPTGIPISDTYLPFKAKYTGAQAVEMKRSLVKRGGVDVPLSSTAYVSLYSIEVDVGGKNFTVILDTGSSDLWLKSSNFTCLNPTTGQPSTNCSANENPFTPTPETFAPLPFANNFNISYATGENLIGQYGQGPVTIGGVTVPDQWFAVAEKGIWQREPAIHGLIGFAGPGLSYLFNGTDPTKDDGENKRVAYNAWIYKAAKEGLFPPYFSLVMNRPIDAQELSNHTFHNLGAIVLGGVPSQSSVPLTDKTATVTASTITANTSSAYILADNVTTPFPVWYATSSIDSFNFPGSTSVTFNETLANPGLGGLPGHWRGILDSGTGLMVIPRELNKAYNALFDPPAQLENDTGLYYVYCNATVPHFSVTINGTEFKVDEADLVVRQGELASDEYCLSGVQGGAINQLPSIYLLGDKFLNNVLTTYNLETNEITISERKPYGKGETFPVTG
ncbi:aspartic peptidase domain-containing protein [Irpex lacteus]|nr:aspartic peptidase domain-containing protein [Irpex lacteus]